jgi:hypothetical protein
LTRGQDDLFKRINSGISQVFIKFGVNTTYLQGNMSLAKGIISQRGFGKFQAVIEVSFLLKFETYLLHYFFQRYFTASSLKIST